MSIKNFIKNNPRKSLLVGTLTFAVLSISSSIGIMLLDRLRKKENLTTDLSAFDGQLIFISGINYWFIACLISSLMLFLFKYAFMFYRKRYLNGNQNNTSKDVVKIETEEEKKIQRKKSATARNIFLLTLLGDVLKMLLWPVIISLATTIDFKKMSTGVLTVAISLFVLLVILSHFHHCLSTSAIFGSIFFKNDSNKKSSPIKKWQYLGYIFLASVIVGSLLAGVRLSIPQIFRALNISNDWVLGFSNLDILTNCHGFIAVCIVDCICLILGYMLIDKFSKKMFTKFADRGNLREVVNEAIFPTAESQEGARHVFDLNAIKTNFGFLKTHIVETNDFNNIKSVLLISLLKTKANLTDKALLFSLRDIFKHPTKIKELRNEILTLRKNSNQLYSKSYTYKKHAKCINIALDHLESQFLIVKPKDKAKSFTKKILLSVASTVVFHMLTQMEASINKYNIKDWRNILMISGLCVIVLMIAFALHLEAGQSLVGSQSIFRNTKPMTSPCCDEELKSSESTMNSVVSSLHNVTEKELSIRIRAFEQYNKRLHVRSQNSSQSITETNGGSCPCSSLSRASQTDHEDFLLNESVDYILSMS